MTHNFESIRTPPLRVCLSNMYDPELLAIYMRKYRDDTHNEPEIQKRLERSIRAVVGDFSATTKIVKSSGKGKIKVRTSVKNKAKVEVYLTSQRLATSYYRLDDLAWIIPLDVKKSKDPAPMCWGISEGTAPAVFERYQEEFNQILKEAQRVYP